MKRQSLFVLYLLLLAICGFVSSIGNSNEVSPDKATDLYVPDQPTDTTAATESSEDLLDATINTPKQIDQLWDAFATTNDIRYVNKLISTYADIMMSNKLNIIDINTLASSFLIEGPKVQDQESRTIINLYKGKGLIKECLLSALDLYFLGMHAKSDDNVYEAINAYIETSTNKNINESLRKIVFLAKFPKLVQNDDGMSMFTADDEPHALKAIDYLKSANQTHDSYIRFLKNITNEFYVDQAFLCILMIAPTAEKSTYHVIIRQPDGNIVFQGTTPILDSINRLCSIPLMSGQLRVPGIYSVTVTNTKDKSAKELLQFSFLLIQ